MTTAFQRRFYAGGGTTTALSGNMGSTDTSFVIDANTGWPGNTPGADFIVVVDRGSPSEEKILCSGNAGTTVTVVTRGYDGTSATTHNSNATVSLCGGAIDFDEDNQISHLLGNMALGEALFGGGAGTLPTVGAFPTTSLNPTSKSSNYTAVNGDFVLCTATMTTTLPAPADADVIGVFADYGATNAAPVSISVNGGTIIGLGVTSSATSITLGAKGAMVVLTSDGINWFVSQGGQDSGWVTPSFLNSWVASSPGVQYRRVGNRVTMRGFMMSGSSGTEAFLLPAGFRTPVSSQQFPMNLGTTSAYGALICLANGNVTAQWSVGSLTTACLDGITYLVD